MPWYGIFFCPLPDTFITVIRPAIPGFLVRPQSLNGMTLMYCPKNINGISDFNDQALPRRL